MTDINEFCEFGENFQDCLKSYVDFDIKENNISEIINKEKERNNIPDNSNSTNFTDSQYLIKTITNREKNKYNDNSKKFMGRKRKFENLNYKKPKKSNTDESNVRRKILTHYHNFLYEKLKRKVKKISYKVYTRESINYLKNVFKMKISTFFKQEINEKGKNKSNDEILNELMKNINTRNFLERNFLEVFYNDFVPILNKEYLDKNKIDDKEYEVWMKIINYSSKKKEEYKNEYEKYGFYKYINEKKERKAQIEYKIVDKIFKIEKIKRDRNSNIKLNNKLFNELNSNIQFNNNELYFPFSSFSSDLFDYNFEQEFHDDLFDYENINI